MNRSRALALLVPALLLAAGCGGGSAAPEVPLEGTSWTLTLMEGKPVTVPEGGETPTLVFADGRASGSSGCNAVTAAYTVDGESLAFGEAAGTRKACPDMFLETAYLGALANTASHRIEGRDLVLRDSNGRETLRFTAPVEEVEE